MAGYTANRTMVSSIKLVADLEPLDDQVGPPQLQSPISPDQHRACRQHPGALNNTDLIFIQSLAISCLASFTDSQGAQCAPYHVTWKEIN